MQTVVIDGEDWLTPRFRDMLVGDHLGYNVANCRMLITNAMTCMRVCGKIVFDLTPSFHLVPPFAVNHVSAEKWPLGLVCLGFSGQGFNRS
jgi:hypothetical protein